VRIQETGKERDKENNHHSRRVPDIIGELA
jgi:hypothetical protein